MKRAIYSRLLLIYPRRFRLEYGWLLTQHFDDLSNSTPRGPRFWIWLLGDTVVSAAREHWRDPMNLLTALAALLLVLPFSFVALNVMEYQLGVPMPWNPFDPVLDRVNDTPWQIAFELAILLSPIAALALTAISQMKIARGEGQAVLARIEILKGSWLTVAVIGISVALLGAMGLYLLAENLPCLLGQQASC